MNIARGINAHITKMHFHDVKCGPRGIDALTELPKVYKACCGEGAETSTSCVSTLFISCKKTSTRHTPDWRFATSRFPVTLPINCWEEKYIWVTLVHNLTKTVCTEFSPTAANSAHAVNGDIAHRDLRGTKVVCSKLSKRDFQLPLWIRWKQNAFRRSIYCD